jgi:hypothetical protein
MPHKKRIKFAEPNMTLLAFNLVITDFSRFLGSPRYFNVHGRLEVQLDQLIPSHCTVNFLLLISQDYALRCRQQKPRAVKTEVFRHFQIDPSALNRSEDCDGFLFKEWHRGNKRQDGGKGGCADWKESA